VPLGNSGASPGLGRSNPAQALLEAVRRGASFSGNERHVVFHNLDGNKFADISGITGLDLTDDGRAACFTDWDDDGDLDLWVNNRNSPQIRFFRNNNPGGMRGLTVKLIGSTCTRDAIGARVILYLKDQKPQTRSVTAGSGFLAQSSKTLHFGLNQDSKIEKIVVHWPGAEVQSYPGLTAGSHVIRQGAKPHAMDFKTRAQRNIPIIASPPSGHTFLAQRLPVATVFPRTAGNAGKPLLVVLASESCPHCETQIAQWQATPPAGIAIEILNIEMLRRNNPLQLQLLQLVYDHFFYVTERPPQTPRSFLIDPEGRLCAIYRGRIDPVVLENDKARLPVDGAALRLAALPFPGYWQSGTVPQAQPLSFAEELLDAGLVDPAGLYIKTHHNLLQRDASFPQLLRRLKALQNK
jgi:hypothetical protein